MNDTLITGATSDTATFKPDIDGDYVLRLQISDGDLIAEDEVLVSAYSTDVPPNALVDSDKSVVAGNPVSFSAAASFDPDDLPQPVSFNWTLAFAPGGSALTSADIVNPNQAVASITPDVAGSYLFRVDVGDGAYIDFAQLVVDACNLPPAPTYLNGTSGGMMNRDHYLDWPAVDNAYEYVIYRRVDGSGDFVEIARTSGLTYTDTRPMGASLVEYYVTPVSTCGEGAASPVITFDGGGGGGGGGHG